MKIIFIFLTFLCSAVYLFILTNNETDQIKTTYSEVKNIQHNQISDLALINQMNILINNIQLSSLGNYQNVNKNMYTANFGSYDWDVGYFGENKFYIEIKNIDKAVCNKLINHFSNAVFVKIDGIISKDCNDLNNIQFIFE